jgi:CDP-2,3-bis-(O-geranylgeranyl)-sn-glycerol synthase
MNWSKEIFFAFWFFLPAGLANMFPIFAAHTPLLRKLEYPLDFHLNFRGKPLFGSHKTVRGLVVGILVAILVVYAQRQLYFHWPFLQTLPLDYKLVSPIFLGLLLGVGAIIGDAMKSFFKRQMDVSSGSSWFPFDQIDYILGGIFFSVWYVRLNLTEYILIFLIFFFLHLVSTNIGYLLGLKKKAI